MKFKVPRVKSGKLSMPNEAIGAEWIKQAAPLLRGLTGLKIIDLNGNAIGCDGCECLVDLLKSLPNLHALNLSYASLSDDSAHVLALYLSGNPSLAILRLNDNSITDAGVGVLAEALEMNKNLTSLYLQQNAISNVGALLFLNVLGKNTDLAVLDLGNNCRVAANTIDRINKKLGASSRTHSDESIHHHLADKRLYQKNVFCAPPSDDNEDEDVDVDGLDSDDSIFIDGPVHGEKRPRWPPPLGESDTSKQTCLAAPTSLVDVETQFHDPDSLFKAGSPCIHEGMLEPSPSP